MKKGFTLIELIIVVIVIGILATIAVPQYMKAVERARGGKALNALTMIAKAEKLYAADKNGAYIACTNATLDANLGSYIEMTDIANDPDWDYSVTLVAGPPPGFLARATRTGGPNNNEYFELSDTGTILPGTWTP